MSALPALSRAQVIFRYIIRFSILSYIQYESNKSPIWDCIYFSDENMFIDVNFYGNPVYFKEWQNKFLVSHLSSFPKSVFDVFSVVPFSRILWPSVTNNCFFVFTLFVSKDETSLKHYCCSCTAIIMIYCFHNKECLGSNFQIKLVNLIFFSRYLHKNEA